MQSLRVSIVEDLTRRNVRERHVGDVVREVLRLREELKVLPAPSWPGTRRITGLAEATGDGDYGGRSFTSPDHLHQCVWY